MATQRIGIIMHGVTGRMGYNQHLIRSVQAIIQDGGLLLSNGDRLLPDPILVGRNGKKMEVLAKEQGIARWSDSIEQCLSNTEDTLFFDAGTTQMRSDLLSQAIQAGKHVYCEKPSADTLENALSVARLARQKGVKHGVVQDKLFLPGLLKLKSLIDSGYFGRILSVRGEFGYWVFEGDWRRAQRPSWNYRKADGGGIILDMLCHWRYLVDNVFGPIQSISCRGATHIGERVDEQGNPYPCTADDSCYATMELDNGIICQFNSSWTVRVRRDDLFVMQVDGSKGSAVVNLRGCQIQGLGMTPKPVWNPDIEQPINFYEGWSEMPDATIYDNAFKIQWELFLCHVVLDEPFPYNLRSGAKGVELAELGLKSSKEKKWIDL